MSDVDTSQTNHLSFCAGYGGIDLGLRRVLPGCRTVAYVEIEAFAIANLVAKMEAGELDQAPIWTDVKTFPAEQFHGLVDIISGGYPCQPFSAAGKRRGTEDPRHLWPFLRGAVRAIRPSRVFFENVEGHISLGLSTVLSDLDEDGYRATWGIFSAAEVGASHQRKRVFIMANSPGIRSKRFSEEAEQVGEASCRGRSDNGSEELGNPKKLGLEHGESRTSQRQRNGVCAVAGTGFAFPARPGQPQFDWEESRTIIPGLDGTTDGCASRVDATTNRVDRLRLLGNGVVPATAAKAWTVLSRRFE